MKIKFLVPSVLALSVLAVPALAYGDYPYNDVPVYGSQLTDMPSGRANVTITGSFLRPEAGYAAREDDYWMRMRRAYYDGYRDGYYDRGYDRY
jgi:hypothetical protein